MIMPYDSSRQAEANAFMAALEGDFANATGVKGRQDYSAFYAPCIPAPLLVLGMNPGGAADSYKIVDVTIGQHEYIEGYGPTSRNLGRLLQDVLRASSAEDIRGVQGSNVVWRRSPNMASLKLSARHAAKETRPFLQRMIERVMPRAILFAGNAAYDLFVQTHECSVTAFPEETVMGPNGSHYAVYFSRNELKLPYLKNAVDAFTILHPCKGLREEASVPLRENFRRLFLEGRQHVYG